MVTGKYIHKTKEEARSGEELGAGFIFLLPFFATLFLIEKFSPADK
jgi:hypothetical protein